MLGEKFSKTHEDVVQHTQFINTANAMQETLADGDCRARLLQGVRRSGYQTSLAWWIVLVAEEEELRFPPCTPQWIHR